MIERFPTFKAGDILNQYPHTLEKEIVLKYHKIRLEYPCRMDAMAINPSAVCYNDDFIFTPGEVVISVNKKIKVTIEVISETGGVLEISERTQRKVLTKHAYQIMTKTLGVMPSLKIDVDASDIIKHCGFGSSSSTISAVSAGINELYGCPIPNPELIKFLASNHGEEIEDENEEELKMVQCIGGGATNGLTKEGIIIIAGKATAIAKLEYESEVLIAIPRDFQTKSADVLMKLEEDNLWKFKRTGEQYAEKIAYELLHKALPGLVNKSIKELADVVFDYRFNMGSIDNCSFVYEKMNEQAKQLRSLYEEGQCELLTLSSVGPAFVALVKDTKQKEICKAKMEEIGMRVEETSICNHTYEVIEKQETKSFWQQEETAKEFAERPVSSYIVNEIEEIANHHSIQKVIDIGCGGGRYARYLKQHGFEVLAVDKYKEMAVSLKEENIPFVQSNMDAIPAKANEFDMILSIGVIHNATTKQEWKDTIKEFYRILKQEGYVILSVFTNDVITEELEDKGNGIYHIVGRPPMVLLSKQEIQKTIEENGFYIEKIVEEHITDVGIGKRNVYTIRLRK